MTFYSTRSRSPESYKNWGLCSSASICSVVKQKFVIEIDPLKSIGQAVPVLPSSVHRSTHRPARRWLRQRGGELRRILCRRAHVTCLGWPSRGRRSRGEARFYSMSRKRVSSFPTRRSIRVTYTTHLAPEISYLGTGFAFQVLPRARLTSEDTG